MGADQVVL